MTLRKTFRLENDSWKEIQFKDLKQDDIFRLLDPHKSLPNTFVDDIEENGKNVFKALTDAAIDSQGDLGCKVEAMYKDTSNIEGLNIVEKE